MYLLRICLQLNLRKPYISLHLLSIKSLCVSGMPPGTKPQPTFGTLVKWNSTRYSNTISKCPKWRVKLYHGLSTQCVGIQWRVMDFLIAVGCCVNVNLVFITWRCAPQRTGYSYEIFWVGKGFPYCPTFPVIVMYSDIHKSISELKPKSTGVACW